MLPIKVVARCVPMDILTKEAADILRYGEIRRKYS
jgi:hypothetical protein